MPAGNRRPVHGWHGDHQDHPGVDRCVHAAQPPRCQGGAGGAGPGGGAQPSAHPPRPRVPTLHRGHHPRGAPYLQRRASRLHPRRH